VQVTEQSIFEALLYFEFIPRPVGGDARIESAYDEAAKCTVFHILFPDHPALSGSIFVVANIDRYTGEPFSHHGKVLYERPGISITKKVPYGGPWRQYLRRAVGLGVALAREDLKPRPKVSDFPSIDTWSVAATEADQFNQSQIKRARSRFAAYDEKQSIQARRGFEPGCMVQGAQRVSQWLQSAWMAS